MSTCRATEGHLEERSPDQHVCSRGTGDGGGHGGHGGHFWFPRNAGNSQKKLTWLFSRSGRSLLSITFAGVLCPHPLLFASPWKESCPSNLETLPKSVPKSFPATPKDPPKALSLPATNHTHPHIQGMIRERVIGVVGEGGGGASRKPFGGHRLLKTFSVKFSLI